MDVNAAESRMRMNATLAELRRHQDDLRIELQEVNKKLGRIVEELEKPKFRDHILSRLEKLWRIVL